MKIIIADDQIPDEAIPDAEVMVEIGNRYPGANPGFIRGFPFMRKMIKTLRDTGFEVHVCNKASQIEGEIDSTEYDIAIVDLGWDGDKNVPDSVNRTWGFEIVKNIKTKRPELPIIMFSFRFTEDNKIALGAAEQEVLPIFKNYNDACITNLIAAIKFLEKSKLSLISKIRVIDLKTYSILSKITTVLFIVALIFVVIGISLLYSGKLEEGAITSSVSIFSSIMSGLFWKYLAKIRQNISS